MEAGGARELLGLGVSLYCLGFIDGVKALVRHPLRRLRRFRGR